MSLSFSENRPATHVLAITSLVLAILGLVPVLPFVGSIGAIITGVIARREIQARPELHAGDGLARAGIILGWVGIALIFLACLALVLFLVPLRANLSLGLTIL